MIYDLVHLTPWQEVSTLFKDNHFNSKQHSSYDLLHEKDESIISRARMLFAHYLHKQ